MIVRYVVEEMPGGFRVAASSSHSEYDELGQLRHGPSCIVTSKADVIDILVGRLRADIDKHVTEEVQPATLTENLT